MQLKPICEFPSKKFYGRKLKTETHDTPFPFDAFWPSSSGLYEVFALLHYSFIASEMYLDPATFLLMLLLKVQLLSAMLLVTKKKLRLRRT